MSTDATHDSREHHHGSPIDIAQNQAIWDERYRSQSQLWSGNPNAVLVGEVSDLAPGTALEVGCGEGADAFWLAEQGWQVTAVDISSVALERARRHASDVDPNIAGRITWLHADVTAWVPPVESYDLVSAQFMQLPTEVRKQLHEQLAGAVAPGGTLLLVGHHPSDLQTKVRRPPLPELFFTAEEVATSLDVRQWDIVLQESRERLATDADGNSVPVHDAVLRARRRG